MLPKIYPPAKMAKPGMLVREITMDLKILYEDTHLIVAEKPAGIITQRDSTGRDSLLDMVMRHVKRQHDGPEDPFLNAVHRLDRTVSGPVVFARNSRAAGRLTEAFRSRNVLKHYIAMVHNPDAAGTPAQGTPEWKTLTHLLERKRDTVRVAAAPSGKTREASLRYTVLDRNGTCALLLVDLLTGRRHQIRVQLSAIGCPVAGDRHYGSPDRTSPDAIGLHSCRLRFNHPEHNTAVEIISEVPARIRRLFPGTLGILESLPRPD